MRVYIFDSHEFNKYFNVPTILFSTLLVCLPLTIVLKVPQNVPCIPPYLDENKLFINSFVCV